MKRSLLIPLLVLTGCLGEIEASTVQPRPNVVFAQPSSKSLVLRVQPGVLDTQHQEGLHSDVLGWRATLANGFKNGFAGYFKPAKPGAPVDLRLEIERADLVWASNGVTSRPQINYRARLVDGNGRTLGATTGTAIAKGAVAPGEVERCIGSSIETMYEELSEKLLTPLEHKGGQPQVRPEPGAGTVEI
jgi:hypothetical protein